MNYKNIEKINNMINELIEENKQIDIMKSKISKIESLKEYNKKVTILNKRVDAYNKRRRKLIAMMEGQKAISQADWQSLTKDEMQKQYEFFSQFRGLTAESDDLLNKLKQHIDSWQDDGGAKECKK